MVTTLERSPEIQEKIDTIRQEAVGDRERAQLGRLDIMLKNASLAVDIAGIVYADPNIEKQELLDHLRESDKILNAEAVGDLVGRLYRRRSEMQSLLEGFKINKMSPEEQGVFLYKQMLTLRGIDPNQYEPKGEIAVNTSNPYVAVVSFYEQEDADRVLGEDLTSLKCVGPYRHVASGSEHRFNVIALRATDSSENYEAMLAHEWQHMFFDLFFDSVGGEVEPSSSGVGSMLYRKPFHEQLKEASNSLVEEYTLHEKEDPLLIRNSESYKFILSASLVRLKSEVLARIVEGASPLSIRSLRHQKREKDSDSSSEVYDYLGRVGLPWELYEMLWDDYEQIARGALGAATYFYDFYKSTSEFYPRLDTYPWLLAQIPVSEWKSSLENLQLMKEVTGYNHVNREYKEIIEQASLMGNPQQEAKFQRELKNYLDEVRNLCFDGQIVDVCKGAVRNIAAHRVKLRSQPKIK